PGACWRGAAMRPVHVDGAARRHAEKLVHRHAERRRLEVEERVLDPADRLLDYRAGALARRAKQIPDDALDGARVSPDDVWCEILDDAGQSARRTMRVRDLGPADGAVVGGRLEEDPRTPAGVAVQRLGLCDVHEAEG